MRKGRKLLATLLTFVCLMTTSTSVMAAEPQSTPEVTTEVAAEAVEAGSIVAHSIYGYAASYTNSSMSSFYVNATGSSSGSGGFTVESYSFSSSNVKIAITLCRPDGSEARTVTLTGNQKIENLTFSNAPAGRYRVDYHVYGSAKGWIGAWVY